MIRPRFAFVQLVLACVLALGVASPFIGEAYSRGSARTSSPRSGGQKTVHVKEYTKKDGKKVAAHDRKAPDSTPAKAAKVSAASTQRRDAKGRFVRSRSMRHAFELQTGYPHGRRGYVVDHIRPLACGGTDTPSNMQWQTVAEGKAKDKTERQSCR